MTDPVREQLLGYLLGALEEDEEAVLDERLKDDESLRRQLTEAWHSLEPLRTGPQEFLPPLSLAARTCEFVAEWAGQFGAQEIGEPAPANSLPVPEHSAPVSFSLHGEASMTPTVAPAETSGGWTWADLAVAASIAAAAFLLVFPAIENSRFQARVAGCQENLRQLGTALAQYSERNQGYFPQIPASGPLAVAGVYAPMLLESGYLDSPDQVVCPGSTLAEADGFSVPDLEQVQAAPTGEKLAELHRWMGGSYGYTLGHTVDGCYRPTKNLHRTHFAVMADAPSYGLPALASLNHGGRGQNVLFEDGHVEFLPLPLPAGYPDDFFLNDTGLVAAGTHLDDSVVGSSAAAPVALETP